MSHNFNHLGKIFHDSLPGIRRIWNNKTIKIGNVKTCSCSCKDTPAWEEFETVLNEKGGFVSAHWDGSAETEEAIKEKTKATIRCIPLNNPQEDGKCILTGKPSKERVLFAIAY